MVSFLSIGLYTMQWSPEFLSYAVYVLFKNRYLFYYSLIQSWYSFFCLGVSLGISKVILFIWEILTKVALYSNKRNLNYKFIFFGIETDKVTMMSKKNVISCDVTLSNFPWKLKFDFCVNLCNVGIHSNVKRSFSRK